MSYLKILGRLHTHFVSIGICAAPKETTLAKRILFVLCGIALCVYFVIAIISALTFFGKNFAFNLPLALCGIYHTGALFGACSTVIITFYFRQDVVLTFLGLQNVINKGRKWNTLIIIYIHCEFFGFICQSPIPEFEAKVSPDLAIEGNVRCETITKILIDYFTVRCILPSVLATFMLIFVQSVVQHGIDYGEYLYIPYGFRYMVSESEIQIHIICQFSIDFYINSNSFIN